MSDQRQDQRRLRRVGGMWSPKAGSKSLGSGSVTIGELRQRFIVMCNDRKRPGSNEPDYVLLSSDEPEVDHYASERPTPAPAFPPAAASTSHVDHSTVDDRLADDEGPF